MTVVYVRQHAAVSRLISGAPFRWIWLLAGRPLYASAGSNARPKFKRFELLHSVCLSDSTASGNVRGLPLPQVSRLMGGLNGPQNGLQAYKEFSYDGCE